MPNRLPLILLALGTFAIGTDGYVVAGILPQIASDLGVSVAAAGQLVTVFALAYAVGSPVLNAFTARAPRRRLLICAMLAFTLANALAAAAPSYPVLAVARVAAALSAAVFVANALAASTQLASEEQRGRALAMVTAGLTVATALGVPLGAFIGTAGNWRATFALITAFAALAMLGLLRALPTLAQPPAVALRERLALTRQPPVLAALGVTVLAFVAGFTVYTYIGPIVQDAAAVGGRGVSALLLVFGAAAVLGNALGGRASDRLGPARTMTAGLLGMAVGLAALGLLATAPPDPDTVAFVLTAAAVATWSTAAWAIAVPVAHRLVALAPHAPAVALSLNASALYGGIALGGVIGGIALDAGSPALLGFIGATVALVTVAVLAYSTHLAARAVGVREHRRPDGQGACETPSCEAA